MFFKYRYFIVFNYEYFSEKGIANRVLDLDEKIESQGGVDEAQKIIREQNDFAITPTIVNFIFLGRINTNS